MRTFDSRHYNIVGYECVSIQEGVGQYYWVLETICPPNYSNGNFQPMRVLVECAKYVDSGRVYILSSDGQKLEVLERRMTLY